MPRSGWINCALLVCLTVFTIDCSRKPEPKQNVSEPKLATSDKNYFVTLSIRPEGKQDDEHWRYVATYTKAGKTAKFGIEFQVQRSKLDNHIHFGRGSFIAIPHSDASVLLSDLELALEARKKFKQDIRVRQLPFTFAVLGENQQRTDDDSFVDSADGGWTATKLFLGPEESEVFFNFEKTGGKAEFSAKDPDCGDGVLRELAKAL